ncbi:hypothetical protein [Algoriphagus chordae]|uniref:Uncharacterized protein n=1 Tax=Algoriphagus chordae TaxID=237019 RepID=A0A2W7R460_9BACT|nr:hypothetical protein [Algoriphagus chordae]PZX54951.1 hypothetical protein LV85_01292 [Algoriphagus chordae]
MTGLVVLDVFISLVFIYLLYSLFAMTVIEAITTSFSSRAKNLITGIDRLLADDQQSNSINHTVLNLFYVKTDNPLTKAFYKHPSIKYLGHKGINSKPSYISKDRFASTLFDLLKQGSYLDEVDNISATLGMIPEYDSSGLVARIKRTEEELKALGQSPDPDKISLESLTEELNFLKEELFQRNNKEHPWEIEGFSLGDETKYQLKTLWKNAANDKAKFRALMENWYDDQMDRIAGWYKRKLTLLTFFVGLIIAGLFNVDTIKLTTDLSKNDDMRALLVDSAKSHIAENPEGGTTATLDSQMKYIDSLNTTLSKYNAVLGASKDDDYTFWTYLGWLITAFAISLGAPFWFDILNKLMKVRNSVQIPVNTASASTSSESKSTNVVG